MFWVDLSYRPLQHRQLQQRQTGHKKAEQRRQQQHEEEETQGRRARTLPLDYLQNTSRHGAGGTTVEASGHGRATPSVSARKRLWRKRRRRASTTWTITVRPHKVYILLYCILHFRPRRRGSGVGPIAVGHKNSSVQRAWNLEAQPYLCGTDGPVVEDADLGVAKT